VNNLIKRQNFDLQLFSANYYTAALIYGRGDMRAQSLSTEFINNMGLMNSYLSPVDEKKRLTFEVPKSFHKRLKMASAKHEKTMADLIIYCVETFLSTTDLGNK
jgi:hypothetical protein